MTQRQLLYELLNDFSVMCGEAWRERSNRQRASAQGTVRSPRKIRRVRATGKCNDDGWNCRQARGQQTLFFVQRERRLLHIPNVNESFHLHAEYTRACRIGFAKRKIHLKSRSTSTVPVFSSACNQ